MSPRDRFKKRNVLRPQFKIGAYNSTLYGLSDKEAEKMRQIASGHIPYKVNQEWRELVEEKSRFIPKIWDGVD